MPGASYEERQSPSHGRGLYTSKDIKAGQLVFEDKTPFVAVLDSPILTKSCSWCFIYVDEVSSEDEISVSACTGCKIVRYCGKACQTAAWKHSHKYECKIFKALYPQVLPNTARMILQILLRRKNNVIAKEEWDEFLRLQHHMDDLEKACRDGSEYAKQTLQNVQLMARAGKEYSASTENTGYVDSLVGRLITNTFTLTSSIFTPLGLVLSLPGSIANHSCMPNAAVNYSGRRVSLRALEPLPIGTELTIAYVSTTLPVPARQIELTNRYHFTCQCEQCTNGLSLNHPDVNPSIEAISTPEKRLSIESQINTLLSEARSLSAAKGLLPIAKAYALFDAHPDYPPYFSPLQQLRLDLIISLQANELWVAAFIQAMIVHFFAHPVVYPQVAHPARVARGWVHAKIAGHIGGLANEPEFAESLGAAEEGDAARELGQRFKIDWGLVVYALIKDVSDQVLKSHGIENRFSMEVGREMGRLKEEARATRGEPSKEDLATAMNTLRLLAMDGWNWWKSWTLERRKKQKLLVSADGNSEDAVGVLLE